MDFKKTYNNTPELETELYYHVDFMEVYDGYLGDFTGEVIPVEPVENPFVVIYGMGLSFPHPNALSEVQKQEYVDNIKEAFNLANLTKFNL